VVTPASPPKGAKPIECSQDTAVPFPSATYVKSLRQLWPMTNEERALVEALCKRIVEEQDPLVFNKLVAQLNDLLERKQQKLEADSN
jgi:hypothetical protein